MSDVGRKVCSRQGAQEQKMTSDQALEFPSCKERAFLQICNGESDMEYTRRDRMTGMVAGYQPRRNQGETESNSGYLEKYPLTGRQ